MKLVALRFNISLTWQSHDSHMIVTCPWSPALVDRKACQWSQLLTEDTILPSYCAPKRHNLQDKVFHTLSHKQLQLSISYTVTQATPALYIMHSHTCNSSSLYQPLSHKQHQLFISYTLTQATPALLYHTLSHKQLQLFISYTLIQPTPALYIIHSHTTNSNSLSESR